MDLRSRLKNDFEKISSHLPSSANSVLTHLSKQFGDYESKVKAFVRDMDHKTKDAKVRSQKQLDTLVAQIRKSRKTLEDRVASVVNAEGKRLNQKVNEVLKILVVAAKAEKASTKKATKKKTSSAKRTTKKRKA